MLGNVRAGGPAGGANVEVCELFLSLQGESTRAGLPCTILRLSGCNLDCRYCDTGYARRRGVLHSVEQILARLTDLRCPRVLVTGGEPLLQEETPELVRCLLDEGYETMVETNGSLDIAALDERAIRIVDVKTPGSGEAARNLPENLGRLTPRDELKFVIVDEPDYQWAAERVDRRALPAGIEVLFSPAHGVLAPADLAGWILRDRLPVRLQLQLHKILWGSDARGV